MRGTDDRRMVTTRYCSEDFLHWWPDQLYGFGHYDSYRHDQHWRYMGTSQAVPIVHVTEAWIQ